MQINLSEISYQHRFNGASLLIAKANRLLDSTGTSGGELTPKELKVIRMAVAYFDMALSLQKPYDPNYPTVINWKCLALIRLGQFETAVEWYGEIVRLSDATDGKSRRNATALLAEEMIQRYAGRKNEALAPDSDGDARTFDDPPYCMVGGQLCQFLQAGKYKLAHGLLAEPLRLKLTVAVLKQQWLSLLQGTEPEMISVTLEKHLTDWPDRRPDDVGWCYFALAGEGWSEGISLVVGRTPQNLQVVTEVEFGRP